VLPLGIDLNLDGSGIYFPLAVLFLGDIGGYSGSVTVGACVCVCGRVWQHGPLFQRCRALRLRALTPHSRHTCLCCAPQARS
jgi:hypothetical protein